MHITYIHVPAGNPKVRIKKFIKVMRVTLIIDPLSRINNSRFFPKALDLANNKFLTEQWSKI